jgi:hypothetical protein
MRCITAHKLINNCKRNWTRIELIAIMKIRWRIKMRMRIRIRVKIEKPNSIKMMKMMVRARVKMRMWSIGIQKSMGNLQKDPPQSIVR